MSKSSEALREAEILFNAQASVKIRPSLCKEGEKEKCKGGKIHSIRKDGVVIVYCKGMTCTTSPENIEIMKRESQGGSSG